LGARKPNRIAKIGNGHLYLREEKLSHLYLREEKLSHLYLREENLSFNNNYMVYEL